MKKSIKVRLNELENKLIKPDKGPMFISIEEGETVPEGFNGKVYIGCSPDDWDEDDEKEKSIRRENAKEK